MKSLATRLVNLSLSVLCAFVIEAATETSAQEPSQDPAITLPQVTVQDTRDKGYVATKATTGTKTDTPIIETPHSISIITREQIEAQGAQDLAQALRYTAGVQGEPFGFDPRFTTVRIRGFDASDTGLFRDGLQLRNPAFAVSFNLEPYSVERVEILKGPASVLYGAGSPGGLVNLVSKRPTQTPLGEFGLEGGSFDRVQGKFDLSGPIDKAGVFSYRLTGLVRDSDTQVHFIENNRYYVAPAFAWRPGEHTTLTFLSHFQQDKTRASQAIPADGTLFANPNGEIPIRRFTGEPDVDRYRRREYSIGYLFEHRASDLLTLRQNARYYANELEQVTIFGSGIDADQRTLFRSVFDGDDKLDGFAIDNQAQLKFATGPAAHTLLAGVDFQRIKVHAVQAFGPAPNLDIFNPVYGAPVTIPPPFLKSDTFETQTGLYLQDQMKLNEKWILSLGGRHDWASNETKDKLAGGGTEQDDTKFTGRAGMAYLFDMGVAPYFSYSRSFLPALGIDASGSPLKPETGQQYEVGVKYQPPGWNSLVTLALFHLTRQNVVQTETAPPFSQVQTGEIRSRGIELEGGAGFDFGLKLIASYTYLDVEITKSIVPGEKGGRPTQIPEHAASLWADYSFRDGVLNGLGIGAGVRYLSSTFGDNLNSLKVPGVTLGDVGLRYDWRDFRISMNVQNVFDKEYAASGFVRGGNFITFGERRIITAGITYRWGR